MKGDGLLQRAGAVAAIAAALGIWGIIAVVTAGTFLRGGSGRQAAVAASAGPETIGLRGSLLGQRGAKVAVIEFSDYECSFCKQFSDTGFSAIRTRYIAPGLVVYGQRHLVLERVHPAARGAAVAAECASKQGKFWQYRERLFASSPQLDPRTLRLVGEGVVPNQRAFEDCLEVSDSRLIEQDSAEAGRLGIRTTPTFLIGSLSPNGTVTIQKRVSGANVKELESAIDEVIGGSQK